MTAMDRRSFLGVGAAAAASGTLLSAVALERLTARSALAASGSGRGLKARAATSVEGYGPVAPMADQRGVEVLALPAGFSYVTFGHIGGRMSDGRPTPLALDGMAAFPGPDGTVRLIRNHEDRNPPGSGSLRAAPRHMYDRLGGGGTTTLDFDPRTRRLVRSFVSLAGTTVNCAGGIAYERAGWISCEETVAGPNHTVEERRFPRRHGYCYFVPVERGRRELAKTLPLRAMGRFAHEAVAVDQRTGIVYLTEDPGSGQGAGFYRFLPKDPLQLERGGRLQMLGVRDTPGRDMRKGQTQGDALAAEWVDIDEPDPEYTTDNDARSVFNQGYAKGGALFNRLEGCWYDEGSVYFVSTSGGNAENGDVNSDGYREGFGQVWEYRPHARHGGRLTLWFESPDGGVLDSPDNLTVTPRGGLLLCEDDASTRYVDTHPTRPGIGHVNRLIGLTVAGDPFEFAVNIFSASELAGACFSADGKWLFFNVFGESEGTPGEFLGGGMTCAVTGPWADGPL